MCVGAFFLCMCDISMSVGTNSVSYSIHLCFVMPNPQTPHTLSSFHSTFSRSLSFHQHHLCTTTFSLSPFLSLSLFLLLYLARARTVNLACALLLLRSLSLLLFSPHSRRKKCSLSLSASPFRSRSPSRSCSLSGSGSGSGSCRLNAHTVVPTLHYHPQAQSAGACAETPSICP